MFECKKCGLCCQNLNLNPIYADLDDGTGVCIYYDAKSKLCSIYEDRPIKCRIDDAYEMFFKDSISKEEYYRLNYEACNQLQNKE